MLVPPCPAQAAHSEQYPDHGSRPSLAPSSHQHQGTLSALNIQFRSPSPPCEGVEHGNEPAGLPVPCAAGMCLGRCCMPASCSSAWEHRRGQPHPQHTVRWWPWGPGSPSPLTSCSPMHQPAAIQASALPASLPLVWICPGETPSSLPLSLSTPRVPAGLFTQWPVEHRLMPIRP